MNFLSQRTEEAFSHSKNLIDSSAAIAAHLKPEIESTPALLNSLHMAAAIIYFLIKNIFEINDPELANHLFHINHFSDLVDSTDPLHALLEAIEIDKIRMPHLKKFQNLSVAAHQVFAGPWDDFLYYIYASTATRSDNLDRVPEDLVALMKTGVFRYPNKLELYSKMWEPTYHFMADVVPKFLYKILIKSAEKSADKNELLSPPLQEKLINNMVLVLQRNVAEAFTAQEYTDISPESERHDEARSLYSRVMYELVELLIKKKYNFAPDWGRFIQIATSLAEQGDIELSFELAQIYLFAGGNDRCSIPIPVKPSRAKALHFLQIVAARSDEPNLADNAKELLYTHFPETNLDADVSLTGEYSYSEVSNIWRPSPDTSSITDAVTVTMECELN